MSEQQGLYEKYYVVRSDGRDQPGGDREDAEYFVLDVVHDRYARKAALAYAKACEKENPQLAKEIRELVEVHACDECDDQGYYFITPDGGKKEKRDCICTEDQT